jgi:hypothetical protein
MAAAETIAVPNHLPGRMSFLPVDLRNSFVYFRLLSIFIVQRGVSQGSKENETNGFRLDVTE